MLKKKVFVDYRQNYKGDPLKTEDEKHYNKSLNLSLV